MILNHKSSPLTRGQQRLQKPYELILLVNQNFCIYITIRQVSTTYDHRLKRIGHPVRSAIHKLQIGRLVVGWVTTSEYLLLYVFCSLQLLFLTRICCVICRCMLPSVCPVVSVAIFFFARVRGQVLTNTGMTKTCVLVYVSQLPRLFRYLCFVKGAPGDLSWQIIVFGQVGEGGVFG